MEDKRWKLHTLCVEEHYEGMGSSVPNSLGFCSRQKFCATFLYHLGLGYQFTALVLNGTGWLSAAAGHTQYISSLSSRRATNNYLQLLKMNDLATVLPIFDTLITQVKGACT
jgi:hypothetical protein